VQLTEQAITKLPEAVDWENWEILPDELFRHFGDRMRGIHWLSQALGVTLLPQSV
jgi:hypothetical protein